jgi:hypothetical protein
VRWRERPGSGRQAVFDESVPLDEQAAEDLRPLSDNPNERNYRLIAELYEQLQGNYDRRGDYWTAGDFHYGEMEVKRLATPRRSPVLRWLHRNLGLVAWYRYASEYGENYLRPAMMLLAVVGIFALLFPLAGLDPAAGTQHGAPSLGNAQLSYWHFADYLKARSAGKWLSAAEFSGNSLMTALSVAGFQKELRYEPSYPWGRALALLELLLTSTLIGLFLLAVRRQFRR